MAAFLDLDAPPRDTRISLPTDTSIAGLRKLKKSVGIVMSKTMRAKTEAAAVKETLDGDEVSVPNLQIGWITVWSIPILTICATILLMIIAALLNLVFWWLPFLRITIPVATHGATFAAAVQRGRTFGVQFHPERSAGPGARLLDNFLRVPVP